jgi:hypothetical protein
MRTAHFLAQVCRVCPACIAKRRFPDTSFARFMSGMEKNCPFCRAYEKLYGGGAKASAPFTNSGGD